MVLIGEGVGIEGGNKMRKVDGTRAGQFDVKRPYKGNF